MIVLSSVDEARNILSTKIDVITKSISNETKSISQFLDIIESSSSKKSQSYLEIQTISSELREIRSESTRISSKILALAFHSQQLDDAITEFCTSPNKQTDEIFERLNKMRNEISLSHDEIERILILFQKYLNIELDNDKEKIPQDKIENLHNALSNVQSITDDDFTQPTDEFFFVDGKQNELEEESNKNREDVIDEIDSKLAKTYFKPVLVQLRERIEVINEDFKEREKKVLQAKGIDIDGMQEDEMKISQSDEESGSDDERERQKRVRKNAEKFRENREFLESKQQLNIFGLPPPIKLLSSNFDEDVIE